MNRRCKFRLNKQPSKYGLLFLLLSFLLFLPLQNFAKDIPITFCESGKKVAVRFDNGKLIEDQLVITLFGNPLVKPIAITAKQKSLKIDIPQVRVPTSFQIVSLQRKKVIGKVIAYPPQTELRWNRRFIKKTTPQKKLRTVSFYYSKDVPTWLVEWLKVRGANVSLVTFDEKSSKIKNVKVEEDDNKTQKVLFIGKQKAGKNPLDSYQIAKSNPSFSLVVIDAGWFGEKIKKPTVIQPESLRNQLKTTCKEKWSQSIPLSYSVTPYNGIVNRWNLIQGENNLLVEAILLRKAEAYQSLPQLLICSYIPWQQQLGRNEFADVLFYRLLLAVAFSRERHLGKFDKIIRYQWKRRDQIDSIRHPVLSKAMKIASSRRYKHLPAVGLELVDLRGDDNRSKEDVKKLLNQISKNNSRNWIVLGNNSHFDTSNKKKSPFPKHVTWLPEDQLPPTPQMQIRLMQELSLKGIDLGGIQNQSKQGEIKK